MYYSFQTQYEQCQALSSDDNSTTLTLFKKWLNEGAFKAYKNLSAEYFYTETADLTVDGTYSYPKPFNCYKIHTIKVTDDNSNDYVVKEFPGDENQWIALRAGVSTDAESDYPTYYFGKKNTYEFYPTPSTSAFTITIKYKKTVKDMSAADYTTGNITTLAAAGTAVTGSGTTWTNAFVGRYFKINDDGIWYEIATRTGNTGITLAREYGGTAIAAGTESYTIGEMNLLPEGYQDLPIQFAMWQYYMQKKDQNAALMYKGNWLEGLLELRQDGGNQTTSGVLEEQIDIIDPNCNPTLTE